MAKLSLLAGTTSKTVKVFIQNNSVTTGAGLTGLAFGTSGLTAYYIREGAGSAVLISLATATLGTWATGGFIVVDGTNMPGLYELGIPNLALASGAKSVVIYLQGAANMAQTLLGIELTAVDNQSTGFGLVNASANVAQWNGTNVASPATAGIPDVNARNINNVAAATPGASGGILISGSNTGTTTFGALTVTAATTLTGNVSMAAGLTITQSSSNASAVSITGNGTGHGILTTSGSGATGDGLKAVAASTNGNGITAVLTGTGRGISALFPEGYTTQSTASSYELGNILWDVHQRLYARSVASTTETVLKQDGSTTAHTITLNSSTAPTSAIQAT